jgi:transcriptional regulator with XRE-family HTH domain
LDRSSFNLEEYDLGSFIQHRRLQLGYNYTTLSKISGVSASQISNAEKGKSKPNLETIYKLAKGLEVEPQILIELAPYLKEDPFYEQNIEDRMMFAVRLRKVRKDRGKTQQYVREKLGVPESWYSELEMAKKHPEDPSVQKLFPKNSLITHLAYILDTTEDWLLGKSDKMDISLEEKIARRKKRSAAVE